MRTLYLLAACTIFTIFGHAAIIYVPDDQPSIQDAITAATDGDIVIVRPGTYVETIDFLGKAITVKSDHGPDTTIIDGGSAGTAVTFQSGEDLASIIEGFTICNGTGTFIAARRWYEGGGIYVLNSSATIRGCTIRDNGSDQGAGIAVRNASPEITDCLFLKNKATEGGGGLGCFEYSQGTVATCTFQGNACSGSSHGGGGIYCSDFSTPVIDNCTIMENDAPMGGAIQLRWYCDVTISNCLITGNTAYRCGGIGIGRSLPMITGCTIIENLAITGGGIGVFRFSYPKIMGNTISGNVALTGSGGGLYCDSPPQEIRDNLIEDNSAGESGGGIYWQSSATGSKISGNTIRGNSADTYGSGLGGGIYIREGYGSKLTIKESVIEDNRAYHGGGIYCVDGDFTMEKNYIIGNSAQKGGGIYFDQGEQVVTNSVVAHNMAEEGGGIFSLDSGSLWNCTVAYNMAYEGAGLYCESRWGLASIINSILWNTPIPPGGEIYVAIDDPIIEYSDVRGGWPGIGNIDSDPLFVSHETRDYHLTYDSPCRDSGLNSARNPRFEDFEGDPRLVGTAIDMGCDEFHEHLYYTGNVIPGSWGKVKVVGTPGTTPVELGLSSNQLDPPQATPFGDLWLQLPLDRRLFMPDINTNGISEFPVKIPDHWLPGESYYLQSLIGPLAPGSKLTNLLTLEVQ